MKDIIYCIPSLHSAGGMERVLTLKANYLVECYNYNITIITYQNKVNLPPFFPLHEKIKIIHLMKDRKENIFHTLYRIVNELTPDYFISLGGTEIMYISLLSSNITSILEWHFCYNQPILETKHSFNPLTRILSYIRREKNVYFAKKFSKLVVLTQRDYLLWKKRKIESIEVINNPVNSIIPCSPFIPEQKNINKIKFISAGRLTTQKAFSRMIEIFNNTSFKYKWELNIYGSGELEDKLKKEIKEYSLDNNIFIHPPVKNLQDKLRNSDFFIMTSIYEGLPMVLLESIEVGLPIIAFNCDTGPSEIIGNKVNGYLIPNNNNKEFSERLSTLSLDSDYFEMSKNAIKSASNFNIEKIGELWNTLFTSNNSNKR
ncbi:TPA: glycosyltransferase family 4 protein [Escherichia coli]